MEPSLAIVTGTSRGLGAALAGQLLHERRHVLGIARGANAELTASAERIGAPLEQWQRDLAQPLAVAEEIETWLRAFEATRFDSAVLINNAATVTRLGPIDETSNDELSASLRVGLEAAVLLTASFLRATRGWRARSLGHIKVLNISSGLGRRAMAGSATYCAAKAGLDNFSRAVALDEAHRGGGARIVSLAPGVVDTDMQAQLRASDPAGFPQIGHFLRLKTDGLLTTPHDAAARVLAFLDRADFGRDPIGDVRD